MWKCKRCGFSRVISLLMKWDSNGTIPMFANRDFCSVIIDTDFLGSLFSRIEEKMGLSISHIVFEAQRNSARVAVDSQLDRPIFNMGRLGIFRHIGAMVNTWIGVWTGQAYTKVLKYKPGRSCDILVKNPYNRNLEAAIILAMYESLERRPFTCEWKEVDGQDVLHLTAGERDSDISDRLEISFPHIRPGDREIKRCPKCGVPDALGYLEWKEKEGVIIDTRRNIRVAFLDRYVPNIVFRELEKELGDAVWEIIIQAEKERTISNLTDLGLADGRNESSSQQEIEDIYRQVLDSLPLLGQGNPVSFRHEEGWLEVKVDNPYNEALLAGNIAGIFEAMEGRESNVTWESPQPSRISITVIEKA